MYIVHLKSYIIDKKCFEKCIKLEKKSHMANLFINICILSRNVPLVGKTNIKNKYNLWFLCIISYN